MRRTARWSDRDGRGLEHCVGLAAALYGELFKSLRERGFHALLAGIALPNAPSVALHRRLGFTSVGVFEEVGFKLGAWHDVSWWQRRA